MSVQIQKPRHTHFFENISNGTIPNIRLPHHLDILIFGVLILLANTHMLSGNFPSHLIFLPKPFVMGEFWRLLTFSFVHISLYHLLLDAGAFILLYTCLEEKSVYKKIYYITISGICALIAALTFSPEISEQGLCGLSGIGHGLMAVVGFDMIRDKKTARLGILTIFLLAMKCVYEMRTGNVLFHFNLCGAPMIASHIGGFIGGLIAAVADMVSGEKT